MDRLKDKKRFVLIPTCNQKLLYFSEFGCIIYAV